MSKDLVVKTNRLNQAFQVLTLAELHIVQLAIVDARETGTGFNSETPLRLDALRYAEAFEQPAKTPTNVWKKLKILYLIEDLVFDDDDGKLVKSRWIQQVKYLDDEGAIELVFTMAVVQELAELMV